LNRACNEITGFSELLQRFERNISILGRSKRTFENYSRHVAALALHFGALPTDLVTLHVFGQRGPPKAYLIGSTLASVN